MALLSINAAVEAATRGAFADDEILAAARQSATVMMDALCDADDVDALPPVERTRAHAGESSR